MFAASDALARSRRRQAVSGQLPAAVSPKDCALEQNRLLLQGTVLLLLGIGG